MSQQNIQIWQHVTSGESYAVEVDEQGKVKAAAGPLYQSEETEARDGDANWDPELAEDIQDFSDRYRLKEEN